MVRLHDIGALGRSFQAATVDRTIEWVDCDGFERFTDNAFINLWRSGKAPRKGAVDGLLRRFFSHRVQSGPALLEKVIRDQWTRGLTDQSIDAKDVVKQPITEVEKN